MKKLILFLAIILLAVGLIYHKTVLRVYQGFSSLQLSKERTKYYSLKPGAQFEDITQKLIQDESVPDNLKQPLIKGKRRIVVFKYKSDNQYVAGYVSYLTQGKHPTMIFLRGGNGFFGIMRPNNRFSFLKNYNVVGTLYRGNIYGGNDELGGADIDDVDNLIRFFPEIERATHVSLKAPFAMMGGSRGAMEMFIALSREGIAKSTVDHAISVSGNIDLHLSMKERPEMQYLFNSKFKESQETDFNNWLNARDPVFNAKNLSKSLKVLLVYGLADNRVSLGEQQNFLAALQKAGITSELVTIPDGEHGLDEHFGELEHEVLRFKKR